MGLLVFPTHTTNVSCDAVSADTTISPAALSGVLDLFREAASEEFFQQLKKELGLKVDDGAAMGCKSDAVDCGAAGRGEAASGAAGRPQAHPGRHGERPYRSLQ